MPSDARAACGPKRWPQSPPGSSTPGRPGRSALTDWMTTCAIYKKRRRSMPASAAEPMWSLDREIVISRVFDAPRELVFRMWTEREHITRWFGPRGFTCTTHEMEARVGGRWRFEMRSQDGKVFPNR